MANDDFLDAMVTFDEEGCLNIAGRELAKEVNEYFASRRKLKIRIVDWGVLGIEYKRSERDKLVIEYQFSKRMKSHRLDCEEPVPPKNLGCTCTNRTEITP